MPRIIDGLPAVYRGLFPAFFEEQIPVEAKATCSACTMLEANCPEAVGAVDGVSRFFRPETKCCTYHPRLPNYLVGALLADSRPETAEGRRRVRERIRSRVGVAPQWLRPPPRFSVLYANSRQAFGRSAAMVCPWYVPQPGLCTIWPFREAVCATYHCKYVAGADGRKFWMQLKVWLSLAEIQLSRDAVFSLMPEYVLAGRDKTDPNAGPLSAADLDDQPPPEAEHRAAWGEWVGREAEFYLACHERVRAKSAVDLERMLGLDGALELEILRRLHGRATGSGLPAVLRLNPAATQKWLPDGSVALACYSEYDALALPAAAWPLLTAFTGREPVAEVRRRLREEQQADLDDELLLTLYRHRILTDE